MSDAAPAARRSLWEEQERNRDRTTFLIAGFIAVLAALGFGLDLFIWSQSSGGDFPQGFVPIATPIALLVGVAQSLGGYYMGANVVLGSTRARPADSANAREAILLNVVQEMRIASGLPMPRVFVVPDPDPNAFAVGRSPEHAAIAVTEGLLESLDREELQGVIAHEMGHVRNLDIRTMTLVAALLGAVVLLSDLSLRMMRFGSGRRSGRSRDSGALILVVFVLWMLLAIVAPSVGQLMALAVSRSREYDADAAAAEFTRNPIGLAKALRKIDAAVQPTKSVKRGSAHLCIADPQGKAVNESEGRVSALFATHPPIMKRIEILESMAGPAQRLRNNLC